MRRASGVFLALGVAACGSTAAPKAPEAVVAADAGAVAIAVEAGASVTDAAATAEVPDAGGTARVAKMMKRVVKARGLAALKEVPGVVLARDGLLAKLKAHVHEEVPPGVIRNEGIELKLLGLLPIALDYEAETFRLFEAQLAGFYEPSDGTMYMAADLQGDAAEATLAHELDHALQDQHFDLKPHSKFEPGKSDAQLAYSALAEGDATSTMVDVLISRAQPGKTALDIPEEVFVDGVLKEIGSGEAATTPHVMQSSLVAPYVYGTLFVHALRRSGGFPAVDAAWAALPTTTEQILHVDKWRKHEPALTVAPPPFATLGAGWAAGDVDTSGELGMRLLFEEWMAAPLAAKAAEGWGGDRMALVANGDLAALAMRVRYDAGPARPAKSDPFALVAAALPALGKTAAKEPAWVCVERAALGPLGVLKKGRDLVLVAGPAKTASDWGSAGTCAQSKTWAKEIAASP
ncbi:MAG TPA: hypothetical protein VGI39_02845 [Polyangiaceae bacterium]|jgi:hypothetical protein